MEIIGRIIYWDFIIKAKREFPEAMNLTWKRNCFGSLGIAAIWCYLKTKGITADQVNRLTRFR